MLEGVVVVVWWLLLIMLHYRRDCCCWDQQSTPPQRGGRRKVFKNTPGAPHYLYNKAVGDYNRNEIFCIKNVNFWLNISVLFWVCRVSVWDVILRCVARVWQWDSLDRTSRTIWQLTKVTRVILIGTIHWQEQAGKQHTDSLISLGWTRKQIEKVGTTQGIQLKAESRRLPSAAN